MPAPTASLLLAPTAGSVPILLEADASASTDAVSYSFTWGDGETTTGNTPTASHTYLDAYDGPVTLTVINALGADSIAVHVTLTAPSQVLTELPGGTGVSYNPPKFGP